MRVLVVDDDRLNLQIIGSLLQRRDHEMIPARSGEEALGLARKSPPDVLLTDVFMPGMDGFQLCMAWQRDPVLSEVPFVFYTSMFTSPADERFALRLGADALLHKPLDNEQLLDTLERAASGAFRDRRAGEADGFDAFGEYTERIVERLEEKVRELDEANRMLLQANEMQSALVECSPLGIVLMDADCSIRLWSPAAENIFRLPSAEIVGVYNPLVHGDPVTEAALRELVVTGGSIHDLELERRRSDGVPIVVSVSASPMMDTDGEVTSLLAMVSDVTERRRDAEDLERAVERLEYAMDSSVQVISKIVEKRDPYTAGHEERVARLAVAIGRHMGLAEEKLRELHTAGQVHDVGKVSVPTEILTKPGRLTSPEWEMIKLHPLVGVDILKTVDLGWPLADIVGQHHERLDGSGYPDGLSSDAILLEARILAVADVVEAMSSHRPYRPARGLEEALAEITTNRGKLYDPDVVDACLAVCEDPAFAL